MTLDDYFYWLIVRFRYRVDCRDRSPFCSDETPKSSLLTLRSPVYADPRNFVRDTELFVEHLDRGALRRKEREESVRLENADSNKLPREVLVLLLHPIKVSLEPVQLFPRAFVPRTLIIDVLSGIDGCRRD